MDSENYPEDFGQTEDMNALYRERAHLVAFLAACYPSALVPGADPDEPGWPVLYVTTPRGQMSWHIDPLDRDLFANVPVVTGADAPTWDGHTTPQKYERLQELTAEKARAATSPNR